MNWNKFVVFDVFVLVCGLNDDFCVVVFIR